MCGGWEGVRACMDGWMDGSSASVCGCVCLLGGTVRLAAPWAYLGSGGERGGGGACLCGWRGEASSLSGTARSPAGARSPPLGSGGRGPGRKWGGPQCRRDALSPPRPVGARAAGRAQGPSGGLRGGRGLPPGAARGRASSRRAGRAGPPTLGSRARPWFAAAASAVSLFFRGGGGGGVGSGRCQRQMASDRYFQKKKFNHRFKPFFPICCAHLLHALQPAADAPRARAQQRPRRSRGRRRRVLLALEEEALRQALLLLADGRRARSSRSAAALV